MSEKRKRARQPAAASAPAGSKAAPAPAAGAVSRSSIPPRSLMNDLNNAAEDRDVARAALVSIRGAWEKYATDLIWEWCADYDGFIKAHGKKSKDDRETIFRTMVKVGGVKHTLGVKELKANYLHRTKKKYVGTGLVHDQQTSSDEDMEGLSQEQDEGEDDEEDDDIDLTPAHTDSDPTEKKKAKASHSAHKSELQDCVHCGHRSQPQFCSDCGMNRLLPFDSPNNKFLRERKHPAVPAASPAAAAAGTSINDTSSGLSKRDKELERQRATGINFPRFDKEVQLSPTEALALSGGAFQGPTYAPPTPALLRLIESGKLVDIGYASPITIADLAAGRIGGSSDADLSVDNGAVRLSEKNIRAPPLASMQQFTFTLVSVIIPALVDRPAGIADWCALARSAYAIEASRGAKAALEFIQRQLTHCVHTRSPFGTVDQNVLLSVLHDPEAKAAPAHGPPKLPAAGGSVSGRRAAANSKPAAASEGGQYTVKCKQFNSAGGCTYPSCRYLHACSICNKPQHGASSCRPRDKPPPLEGAAGGNPARANSNSKHEGQSS
jgi:hypothetical protein